MTMIKHVLAAAALVATVSVASAADMRPVYKATPAPAPVLQLVRLLYRRTWRLRLGRSERQSVRPHRIAPRRRRVRRRPDRLELAGTRLAMGVGHRGRCIVRQHRRHRRSGRRIDRAPTSSRSAPSAAASVTRSIARSGTSPAAGPGSTTTSPSPRPASAPSAPPIRIGAGRSAAASNGRSTTTGASRPNISSSTRPENHFADILGPNFSLDADIHTVRVGLNYRFGGGAYGKGPVVARY